MLEIGKRFWFCSSHRYWREDWSASENLKFFNQKSQGLHGHGSNYELWAYFSGDIQPKTGMIKSLSEIKTSMQTQILSHYDHHYLNADTSPFNFGKIIPTIDNIGRQLFKDITNYFSPFGLYTSELILSEYPGQKVVVNNDTVIAQHDITLHNLPLTQYILGQHFDQPYPITLTLGFEYPPDLLAETYLIRQYLGVQLENWAKGLMQAYIGRPGLALSQYFSLWWESLSTLGPLRFIEVTHLDRIYRYNGDEELSVSLKHIIYATHFLSDPQLSLVENENLFGECIRPHGHSFVLKSEYIFNLSQISSFFEDEIGQLDLELGIFYDRFNYKSLCNDIPNYQDHVVTCEFWISQIGRSLSLQFPTWKSLTLEETPTNRFRFS